MGLYEGLTLVCWNMNVRKLNSLGKTVLKFGVTKLPSLDFPVVDISDLAMWSLFGLFRDF